MNPRNIMFDLALANGGNFSNINQFCDTVVDEFELNSYEDIHQLLNYDIKGIKEKTSHKTILRNTLCDELKDYSMEKYRNIDMEELKKMLQKHLELIVLFFQSIGLNVPSNIEIFFCEEFPFPFHNNKGLALAPDYFDEKKYGIKKGIYFLIKNLSLYQSRLLIAHEIIHHICAQHQPDLLARGLEEGLCELIGSYIANSTVFTDPIPENYIKYRRFKYNNPNQKFRLYTDYMRLAYLLLRQVGLPGVVNIINAGRGMIKSVESTLLHGDTVDVDYQFSEVITNDLTNSLDRIMLGSIENEVVSPLSYYIINNYDGEIDIVSFATKHNLGVAECKESFKEIQKRIYGCVVEENVIEFSDLEQIRANGNVLYECKR